MAAHKPGAGPPRIYADEVFLAICERHSLGEDILKILEDDGMPNWVSFFRNCIEDRGAENVELRTAYAQAHESWAHCAVAECARIANVQEAGEEVTVSEAPTGTTRSVKSYDMLGHRKLKIDTRLWFAERVLASIYARKSTHTLQNPDGSALATPAISVTVLPAPKEE